MLSFTIIYYHLLSFICYRLIVYYNLLSFTLICYHLLSFTVLSFTIICYLSAKITLNSKRFPRLKPLIKSSVLASLHSKRISALVPFLSRPQAIRTSPLPPFGLNFFELSLSSLQQRSGLQRLGDAENTFQGLKSFVLFPRCLFYKRIWRGSIPPNSTPEKRSCADTPLHLKL